MIILEVTSELPQRSPSCGAIDVHRHFFPPSWSEALEGWVRRGGSGEAQLGAATRWSFEHMLQDLDQHEIAGALLSLPNPGVDMDAAGGEQDRALARRCNLEGAEFVSRRPDRLGLFATLPMRDPAAALGEIAFALDELKADGICLYTSAGATNLGDEATLPLLEELDRRSATVLVHPATPDCCGALPGLRPGLLELPFDTTRAIARLHAAGLLARFANIRLIFCHGGGALPFLASRLALLGGPAFADNSLGRCPNLFFDTALTLGADALDLLRRFAPLENILLGTDHPFGSTKAHLAALATGVFSNGEQLRVNRTNAQALFGGLMTRIQAATLGQRAADEQ